MMKSFYQWCIENEKTDLINRFDEIKNNCISKDVSFKNNKKFWFKQIVEESFELINLDKREKVLDYNDEEILLLRNKLKDLHIKYGHGVCLCKPIHELFHKTYGYLNNTYEQFLDFINQLKIGKFDNWLLENNIKLDINSEIIKYINTKIQ